MAEPTHRQRQFGLAEATTAVDTEAERKGALGTDAAVNMGEPPTGGSELDFGIIDISGGQANSVVVNSRIDWTADGGNTLVETFRVYLLAADNGFTGGSTVVNYETVSGADQGAPSATENYVANAVVGSYTWQAVPATDPASINLYPTDEGTSMVLSTTSDDALLFAMYVQVDAAEVTGTYKAADAGKEFRFTFKYAYS